MLTILIGCYTVIQFRTKVFVFRVEGLGVCSRLQTVSKPSDAMEVRAKGSAFESLGFRFNGSVKRIQGFIQVDGLQNPQFESTHVSPGPVNPKRTFYP